MSTNQALGLLVGITVIVALLADFLFLPPLLMLLDGTKETSEEIRGTAEATARIDPGDAIAWVDISCWMRRRHGALSGKGGTIARLPVFLPAALWMLLSVLATGASADTGIADRIEVSGRLSAETRLYPETAAPPRQRSHASGFAGEATAYIEDDDGRSVTVTPFYRYDAGDPDRTHADLREAYLLLHGDVGEGEWELRLGVDRVFWGVVESRSLVDIVNQTDLVEQPNEKTKKGQPMVHLTWSARLGGAGVVRADLAPPPQLSGPARPPASRARRGPRAHLLRVRRRRVASRFRRPVQRQLRAGRCRAQRVRRHQPRAHPSADAGGLGIGSRAALRADPPIRSGYPSSPPAPGFSSWKPSTAPARRTAGSIDTSNTGKKATAAFILGGEYTFNSVWGSGSDLSLLAEWARDGRGRWAPNAFENDIFLAARLGLNDEQSTEFVVSILASLANSSRVFSAEFKRRLSDRWSLHAETTVYLGIDRDDAVYDVRRDNFIGVNLDYNF